MQDTWPTHAAIHELGEEIRLLTTQLKNRRA
jgi:hypothetical protein